VVPFACGLISLLAVVLYRQVEGHWTEGVFSPADRAAVLVSAVGRCVRARWVGPALFLVIVTWILVVEGLADTYQAILSSDSRPSVMAPKPMETQVDAR
jgi:hypothetical protein